MVDKRPASEYMEEARKAINKVDNFNERHNISGRALSSAIIVILIIILCGVYVWQRKHPKPAAPETPAVEETQTAAPEEPAPEENTEAPAEEAVTEEPAEETDEPAEENTEGESEETEEEGSGEEESEEE